MSAARRIWIVGASGVVGRAAFDHFASQGWETVGLSRRKPDLDVGTHVSVDLMDTERCRSALAPLAPPTHVVFAALQEAPGLLPGWFDPAQMEVNRGMLANLLDAAESGGALEHVSLLQGTKAYGAHVGRMKVPGREREPRHDHPNFYWLQEDLLRERAAAAGYAFTIWRPPIIFGHAFGAPMNPIAPLVTFAALEKAAGRPLCWPGDRTEPIDAMDARLLARALCWGATAEAARGETFNVSNGDVFVWENVWGRLAEAFGMEVGAPASLRLAETMPARGAEWDAVVTTHGLRAPDLASFVGDSFVYADLYFGSTQAGAVPSNLLSTIKLRQAGFHDCIDSEDMLVEWIAWMQQEKLIPPR